MIEQFPVLGEVYWGNTLYAYLKSAVIFFGSLFLLYLLNTIVMVRVKKLAKQTATTKDDFLVEMINKKVIPLFYLASFYFAVKQLVLSEKIDHVVSSVTLVFFVFQVARLLLAVLMKVMHSYWSREGTPDAGSIASNTMMSVIRVVVWGIATVFILDNLGFNISAIIAGLGIGGIAVALAAQNILGDLFNYFVIFFDKPFRKDDFVILDSYMGTIENVGLKTTRIRSLGGEQIVISNSDLTSSRLRNYKRMQIRRILFKLGVTYQTSLDRMKRAPEIIKEVIEKTEDTRFDRAHFSAFGDFSLNLEVVYYALSSDYNVYMGIQQKINYGIMEAFEKEGLEFAYPTQTVFVHKEN